MMTKHARTLLLIGMTAIHAVGDLAKIEAFVIDADDGCPIPNITVTASFGNDNGWKAWTESAPINRDIQTTDVHGRCLLSGKTNNGKVGCWVDGKQQNHYGTRSGTGFELEKKNLLGVWQPDNLVATIKLQRVDHPIPLFVKAVRMEGEADVAERFEGRLSYDVICGDWLPPVGKGVKEDIVFERIPRKILSHAELRGRSDITGRSFMDEIKVSFPGEENGIVDTRDSIGGMLIKTAPDSGFAPRYTLWQKLDSHLKYKNSNDKGKCLCFRIRTKKDIHGNIVSSCYGKIYGDINITLGYEYAIGGVEFLYYLNPTPNDRNLEWDMKNNLCPNPGEIGQRQP